MDKFVAIKGIAAPLPMSNVDTDMIIPKKYLTTLTRSGLGQGLFSELRYNQDGSEREDFILNQGVYRNASILIAGANFGAGSSREHAPWALLDFGIKVIIAPSFADIFYNNCFQNGILPIKLPLADVSRLMAYAERAEKPVLGVDLIKQQISGFGDEPLTFTIADFLKTYLLAGMDQIDITLKSSAAIDDFETAMARERPWI